MPSVLTIPEVQSITLSGGPTLQYVEQGDPDGIPMLLLHGVTDSWRSFEPVLPYLPESIRAFALTQQGHGDSERPAAGYHLRDFAADVAGFMDALGIESATVVGHSMGSAVAQRFALDYPARTRAVVLAGAFSSFRGSPAVAEFAGEVATLVDPLPRAVAQEFQESTLANPISPEWLETFVQESLKVPARVWRAAFAAFMDDENAGQLGGIAAPTLIVWGDQDAFCPRVQQDEMIRVIPNARLAVYEGAGHALHWEQPERFAADLSAFVTDIAR